MTRNHTRTRTPEAPFTEILIPKGNEGHEETGNKEESDRNSARGDFEDYTGEQSCTPHSARPPQCETEEGHVLPHLTSHIISLPGDTSEQEEVDGHECQHRQSRDGQIQLTTHQPRGPLRSQVPSKAAKHVHSSQCLPGDRSLGTLYHVVVFHLAE